MRSPVHPLQHSLVASLLLSGLALSSCSAATQSSSVPASAPVDAARMNELASLDAAQVAKQAPAGASAGQNTARSATAVPQQKPQLIKTASLGLRVKDVEQAMQQATQTITRHGGDVLNLQDQVPQNNVAHQASLTLRVPQAQLDATLTDLAKLGTVETRSIQAEDVASQLVDYASRLKNLRKSEEVVLKIMDRSGSISDVLKVSGELSQIRNEIEQIQGQVQHLQQQVAFSTITLILREPIAQTQQSVPVGDRLQESWTQSTHALGETTMKLTRMGIWLFVFSPYLLAVGALLWLGSKRISKRSPNPQSTLPTPDAEP